MSEDSIWISAPDEDGILHAVELYEFDVRRWFMEARFEHAIDTFRVVQRIIETRQSMKPKRKQRKRRSDAGTKRGPEPDIKDQDRKRFESGLP
jgi:hypothetical protein